MCLPSTGHIQVEGSESVGATSHFELGAPPRFALREPERLPIRIESPVQPREPGRGRRKARAVGEVCMRSVILPYVTTRSKLLTSLPLTLQHPGDMLQEMPLDPRRMPPLPPGARRRARGKEEPRFRPTAHAAESSSDAPAGCLRIPALAPSVGRPGGAGRRGDPSTGQKPATDFARRGGVAGLRRVGLDKFTVVCCAPWY